MTKDMGRGIFATKDLRRGELIVVEKSISDAIDDEMLIDIGFNKMHTPGYTQPTAYKELVK